ncbi:acyl carrier protein [Paenibacillus gansuensis]|uniref:Acyl carrier protein n=1 Tax=Paenibacillus gansuensis TaxID=306542 RepID=A0ABW5PIT9_9BACL
MNSEEVLKIVNNKMIDLGIISEGEILQPNVDLMDVGLDSVNLMSLIIELEEQTGVIVSDSDLILGNFSTIEAIMQYFYENVNT